MPPLAIRRLFGSLDHGARLRFMDPKTRELLTLNLRAIDRLPEGEQTAELRRLVQIVERSSGDVDADLLAYSRRMRDLLQTEDTSDDGDSTTHGPLSLEQERALLDDETLAAILDDIERNEPGIDSEEVEDQMRRLGEL